MKLKSGHEVIKPDQKEFEELVAEFPGYKTGVIWLKPGNWFFHSTYLKYADKIYDYQFRSSDVVIMTYPKCGTTWMQEIVWTMRNNTSFTHPDARLAASLRAPFIESDFLDDPIIISNHDEYVLDYFKRICPGKDPDDGMYIQITDNSPDPRTIKTHLPFSLINPKLIDTSKVIYIARNPKDVCLSYFHHVQLFPKIYGFNGSFDQFVDHFINDKVIYSSYWTQLREAWQKRNHPNLYFCYFEDMKKNPKKIIEDLNKFMETNLSEDTIDKIVEYTSFSAMKERDSFSGGKDGSFFRKGQANDWKKMFSPKQEEKMNLWASKYLPDFDSDFLYACKT